MTITYYIYNYIFAALLWKGFLQHAGVSCFEDSLQTIAAEILDCSLRQTGWLVRTSFVLLVAPPSQFYSWRLYVVLIKVLSASEEHACRWRSLRGWSERVRGFITASLKPPLPPSPSFLSPHLLLDPCSSGYHISRPPPIVLCLVYASPPSIHLFTSIVKPELWSLALWRCQRRG